MQNKNNGVKALCQRDEYLVEYLTQRSFYDTQRLDEEYKERVTLPQIEMIDYHGSANVGNCNLIQNMETDSFHELWSQM